MLEDDLLDEYQRLHDTLKPGAYEEFARLAIPRLIRIARRGLRFEQTARTALVGLVETYARFRNCYLVDWDAPARAARTALDELDRPGDAPIDT